MKLEEEAGHKWEKETMSDMNFNIVVNSWNEWDPLKHIIVGRADGTMVPAPEPAMVRHHLKDGMPAGKFGPMPQERTAKANEQLDNFARILEDRGIRVDRPTPIDFSQSVQTPDWVQASMFGVMPPRDLLLTVGNEILEATMSQRSRWFEYICCRPLLEQYFKEDSNFRWETAPKPRLTEASYKQDFWQEWRGLSKEQKMNRALNRDWGLTEKEPLFDAADVARFGKDLFVQISRMTNHAGVEWLRRHYPDQRVHLVHFREAEPVHIDATFCPLRPGLALGNPKRPPLQQELRDLFKKNDWEIVDAAQPAQTDYASLSTCSPWLTMNFLVLDPKTICVEAQEKAQMELLDNLGFEVIPIPFWEVSAFGGGLHCATADVYREGFCEDYFPNQVEEF